MSCSVVFGPLNSLDFVEVRNNVIRIPEVILKIREAQEIWDKSCGSRFSFHHFLSTHDHSFFNNLNLKTLTLAIVQLGLYDRYKRLFGQPDYIVGNIENESSALVAVGKIKFEELVERSQACELVRPLVPLRVTESDILMGQSLPKFQAYRLSVGDQPIEDIGETNMNLDQILLQMVEKHGTKKIVHVGPGLMEKSKCFEHLALADVQIVESIDVDPMLQWFWSDLRMYDMEAQAAQ